MASPETQKSAKSPLVAVTLSAFLPGAGQSRQGRKKMALLMYAVFAVLLTLFSYWLITTYNAALNAAMARFSPLEPPTPAEALGAVKTALVASATDSRIIIVLILLPFVHLWSMLDAYRAHGKRKD